MSREMGILDIYKVLDKGTKLIISDGYSGEYLLPLGGKTYILPDDIPISCFDWHVERVYIQTTGIMDIQVSRS